MGLFSMAEFQGELRPAEFYLRPSPLAPPVARGQGDFQRLREAAFGALSYRTGPATAHGPRNAIEAFPMYSQRFRDDFHPARSQYRARHPSQR
jgi:hypothetical protein